MYNEIVRAFLVKMSEKLLEKLAQSSFRRRFKLSLKDRAYIKSKGLKTIEAHARDFIAKRIAPSSIFNDGKQTPFKNHPVFVAQHATATCCRSCIMKWHSFPKNVQLTDAQQNYLVEIVMIWIIRHYNT